MHLSTVPDRCSGFRIVCYWLSHTFRCYSSDLPTRQFLHYFLLLSPKLVPPLLPALCAVGVLLHPWTLNAISVPPSWKEVGLIHCFSCSRLPGSVSLPSALSIQGSLAHSARKKYSRRPSQAKARHRGSCVYLYHQLQMKADLEEGPKILNLAGFRQRAPRRVT